MAKGYHVLAGFCRDLRHAVGDAAEGSDEAAQLVDNFNELLDILDAGSSDEDAGREKDDGDGIINDAADAGAPLGAVAQMGGGQGVGSGRQATTVHSTRAGTRQRRATSAATDRVRLPKCRGGE